jgi:hypothetical protein
LWFAAPPQAEVGGYSNYSKYNCSIPRCQGTMLACFEM